MKNFHQMVVGFRVDIKIFYTNSLSHIFYFLFKDGTFRDLISLLPYFLPHENESPGPRTSDAMSNIAVN